MLSEPPSIPGSAPTAVALSREVSETIGRRYSECAAARFGIDQARFSEIVSAVILRYAAGEPATEQLELLATIRVEELALARACSAGNEAAWEEFLTRFRASLYEAAYRIARDEATGRELADGLYADLYGIPNESGRRTSKLDYYMGRGSLEGWLRTVLSQQYVDRYRSQRKDVSLEEQVEAGASFAARPEPSEAPPDTRVAAAVRETLAELGAEERFLLTSYFLDQRTLSEIGRMLRVHESTISRKLERLTAELRKRVRKRLLASGIAARRCDELLAELDVRDLEIDVAANLRQEKRVHAFYSKDVITKGACNKDGPSP